MLGFALDASEEDASWLHFLGSLKRRGVKGVQSLTSDAHEGPKTALDEVLAGVAWQRCRVHSIRNLLAHVPRGDKPTVAALRTIFAQRDRQAAGVQLAEVVQAMQRGWPKAAEPMGQAEDDILAYMAFLAALWTWISSTNPLERFNKEVKRRTVDFGSFEYYSGLVLLWDLPLRHRRRQKELYVTRHAGSWGGGCTMDRGKGPCLRSSGSKSNVPSMSCSSC